MNFNKRLGNGGIPENMNNSIPHTTGEISSRCVSLLGIYRLNFDQQRDISHPEILKLINGEEYFLNNFEENGYGSIERRKPHKGTGYALVSGQYFEKRGDMQGIELFNDSQEVGKTFYTDTKGEKCITPIYFVGNIPGQTVPMGGALNHRDILNACEELLS